MILLIAGIVDAGPHVPAIWDGGQHKPDYTMQIAKARSQAQRAMRLLRAEPGMLARIARAINVNPQAVSQWRMVPLDRLLVVERLSGIPRERLRPDVNMIWKEPRKQNKSGG